MFNHKEIESSIQKYWEENEIYEKVKAQNKDGKPFYFCDGPPYVTGYVHPGTILNKSIKDAVLRYLRFMGYNVQSRPGFDTHGLPIEVKVEQTLGLKSKKEIEEIGIDKFIEECKKFVHKYREIMTTQFRSAGIWMDWENPYLTYKDSFIEKSWATLKGAHEKQLLKKGKYVVAYCPRCETSVANYELEYHNKKDPSVFVKFKLEDEDAYLIIWTTTPWTLVANMAVMAHPTEKYVRVKVGDEQWILAEKRLEHVMGLIGESPVVLETFEGSQLKGRCYVHPFQDLISKKTTRKVVLSEDYVSMEEGSGLVHCAPGHGHEDFLVGRLYGLEVFSPVDDHARYTEEAGEFKGLAISEANEKILDVLKSRGLLVHRGVVEHRYPHCWRCKTPLIFRATPQWFIEISKLKEDMVRAIEDDTIWQPGFAKERMLLFLENAPDWCISRQRYWGIPLPIWVCERCGNIEVVGSRGELGDQGRGVELHRPFVDDIELTCECGGKMKRVSDVLDVWFDSGNAVWASLSDEEAKVFGERAEFIVEGQDQIRGWFYSLLGCGMVRYGKPAYKHVLMHGFFVDEKGEKMSKSVGNFVPWEEVLDRYGADAFRLWGLSNVIWEDIKFNWNSIKEAHADLNIFLNLIRYLQRFYTPDEKIEKGAYVGTLKERLITRFDDLDVEDRYVLSKLEDVKKRFEAGFAAYALHDAVRALRAFMVQDISRFYMKVLKDKLGSLEGEARQRKLDVLYVVMFELSQLLGVVAPHVADHAYLTFFKNQEGAESVFQHRLSKVETSIILTSLERKMEYVDKIVSTALDMRQKAGVNLRWPLRKLVVYSDEDDVRDAVKIGAEIIKRLTNVKEVEIEQLSNHPEKEEMTNDQPFALLLDVELDDELRAEGYFNEIKRRVQLLRKELGLVEQDRISVGLVGDDQLMEAVKKFEKRLKKETNCVNVVIGSHLENAALNKKFKIKSLDIEIDVEKLN